jgi:SpoVK/Ycf46/Vps4 family AAA+-type ATPase
MNKRIYLFEDVDSILEVLKERENKEKENKEVSEDQNVLIQALISKKAVSNDKGKSNDRLNLGFFLNLIDGVLETPGRILILSTNHPEKLDRALVRPGRIDIKVHLEKCSKDMIRDILNHYYENDERVEESILDGLFDKDITPAELYQICFKYEKYNSFKNDILDNVDTVFNMYIDREEDEKLNNLLKISNINNKEPKSCSKLLKRNLKPIKHIKSNFMEVDNNNDIPDGDRHNNVNNYNSDSNSD